jgi:hypothetical protein
MARDWGLAFRRAVKAAAVGAVAAVGDRGVCGVTLRTGRTMPGGPGSGRRACRTQPVKRGATVSWAQRRNVSRRVRGAVPLAATNRTRATTRCRPKP